MPPGATPRGAEISWGPFLVPYGGTYHELFLPGGVPLCQITRYAHFLRKASENILAEVAPTLICPRSLAPGSRKSIVIQNSFWPGGIAGKIPPAPLTIGGCPYRILAGMAPGHNWGGA